MTQLPPLEALHPAVVHFPIALLLTAPLFLLLGFAWEKQRPALWLGALLLILFGALGTQSAVITGERTQDTVKKLYTLSPQAHETMEHHEELGEQARTLFVVLALLLLVGAFIHANYHRLLKRPLPPRLLLVVMAIFTVVYVGACVVLLRTAALGGDLVHKYGIHAPLGAATSAAHNSDDPDKAESHD